MRRENRPCRVWPLALAVLCVLVLLIGCRERAHDPEPAAGPAQEPPADIEVVSYLERPMPLAKVEVASELLAVWRDYSPARPVLVLLSAEPMLEPIPAEVSREVSRLARSAGREELRRRGTTRAADPVMLPAMTLDVALRSGWFSEVRWVLPVSDETGGLDVNAFREQMARTKVLSDSEVSSIARDGGLLRARWRSVPFAVSTLSEFSAGHRPVVLHFDQSWFQQVYVNEITTPLIPLVYQALKKLRDKRIPVVAISFCYGNQEQRISLDVRFLGEVLASLSGEPALLEQPMPKAWRRQGDVLYLENFFEKERIEKAALEMGEEDSQSAWIHFTLYRAAAANRKGDVALQRLAEAVRRDPLYAYEYLGLSEMAYRKGRPDEAMRMLQLANASIPEDPFVALKIAQLAGELGDRAEALDKVKKLKQLPWSTLYYSGMPDYLTGFEAYLTAGEPSAAPPWKLPQDVQH